jgi:hypothetical protein
LSINSAVKTNFFFLTFIVMATYVIINILMAFVIDVYRSIEDDQKTEKQERKAFIEFGREATNSLAKEQVSKVLNKRSSRKLEKS